MSIFSKAAQGLNLSPVQRAFLKLLKGWFYTALGTGIITGSQYVMGAAVIDWQKLIYIVGTGILLSVLSALDKYFSAQGDIPLALATEAAIQKVQQLPPPLPASPAPVANFSQAQRTPEPIVLQPRQQSVAPTLQGMTTSQMPASQVPQVPFPSSPNTTGSVPNAPLSFGDTGIVPTVK